MTVIGTEPEVLTRKDVEHGRWQTDVCAPKRGLPHTDIINRKIVAPGDESAMSRVIRAHEMMHAKISPGAEFKKWVAREIASEEALIACEELRVNFLVGRAGFDVMNDLSDDGETADGERIAMLGDWHSAVMFAIATAGTASSKKYLTGVRRCRRDWGTHLASIQKRAIQHFKKIEQQQRGWETRSVLASTNVDETTGLAPLGFRYTEALAEWIDRIVGQAPPKPDSEDSEDSAGSGETKPGETTKAITPEEFGELLKAKTIDTVSSSDSIPAWGELKFGKVQLDVISTGTMGKKRVATNMGRNPRRVNRYLTDPEYRIFDRRVRARGGIVVLDCSVSMSFTRDQIHTIVKHAPGATVLAYSWNRQGGDNAWILAQNGKMYRELDNIAAGNGVDLPALQWAIKNRRRNEPIVWVSDGGVSGIGDGFHETLDRQCAKYVLKNRILCAKHMTDAVELFKKMATGQKPVTTLPPRLRSYASGQ